MSVSLVTKATVRDGGDEWHIECLMADGQKYAAVTVDKGAEGLADAIAKFLNGVAPIEPKELAEVVERIENPSISRTIYDYPEDKGVAYTPVRNTDLRTLLRHARASRITEDQREAVRLLLDMPSACTRYDEVIENNRRRAFARAAFPAELGEVEG